MSNLPFKIAYLDINDQMVEDYSMNPSKYGGGRVVAASFLDRFNNFHIYGNEKCFENVKEEKRNQCFVLRSWERKAMREGGDIYLKELGYDLAVHHFSNIYINTNVPTAVWPVGYSELIHPNNKHILLFDKKNQAPQFYSNNHVIHDVVIGPRMPEFQEYEKEDLIVNIGRITPTYQSIQIAQLAHKYKVPMVFAGPLDEGNNYGYEFMKCVDGDVVQYYGVIDNDIKLDLFKRARITCQMMNYPISITLSQKEASARGVGCFCTPIGQYRTWGRDGYNKFIVRSEEDFVIGWGKRYQLKQKDIYDSILCFSEEKMIETFLQAFKQIIMNHK